MDCERCFKEGAHFTGFSSGSGPHPADAQNTPENAPGGYYWLCDECLTEVALEEHLKEHPEPSELVTCEILYQHFGEYSYTPMQPVDIYDGQVDLEQMTTALWSSDDWRPVEVKKYAVHKVELPAWLSPTEFVNNYSKWFASWGQGVDKTWSQNWQRFLVYRLNTAQRSACLKLLKTKSFKSTFRQSLHNQLIAWLSDPNPRYTTPFSQKQWESLLKYERVR